MDAAPSFRVYTARELKHVVLRPSYRPLPERGLREELKTSLDETVARLRTTRPLVLVKGALLVLAATVALFVGLLALANATDDTRVRSKSARTARVDAPAAPPVVVDLPASPAPASDAPVASPPTDFELPDDSVKPRTANKPRRAAPKHRTRPAGPSVTIRTAPF